VGFGSISTLLRRVEVSCLTTDGLLIASILAVAPEGSSILVRLRLNLQSRTKTTAHLLRPPQFLDTKLPLGWRNLRDDGEEEVGDEREERGEAKEKVEW